MLKIILEEVEYRFNNGTIPTPEGPKPIRVLSIIDHKSGIEVELPLVGKETIEQFEREAAGSALVRAPASALSAL